MTRAKLIEELRKKAKDFEGYCCSALMLEAANKLEKIKKSKRKSNKNIPHLTY